MESPGFAASAGIGLLSGLLGSTLFGLTAWGCLVLAVGIWFLAAALVSAANR
jgi:type IV secretory pathway TrbD component